MPLLTATTFNTDNDDVLNAAARTRYTQVVVENYIALLERLGPSAGPDVANDTFRLAEFIRSRSVQKALTASGARMNTSDPKLAAALRQEQDLRQQIGTQLGQLNSLLALPAAERDDAGVAAMRKQIERMRAEHLRVRADIDRQLPGICRPDRSEAADVGADQGDAASPARPCCRSISAATRASSGRSRRTARSSSQRCGKARPRSRTRSRSCARRWSRRRR